MSDENKELTVPEDSYIASDTSSNTESGLAVIDSNLNKESIKLIEQIIAESDEQKTRDLTQLFNTNQNKKTMIRVNKLSNLLDTITDQALARFTTRPDEISNKELFDGLKIVQDLIERGQKQVSGAGESPLIQVNQQTNEVNIGGSPGSLSRDSRERVKAAVLNLLDNINTKANVIEAEDTDITEVETVEFNDGKEDENNG